MTLHEEEEHRNRQVEYDLYDSVCLSELLLCTLSKMDRVN